MKNLAAPVFEVSPGLNGAASRQAEAKVKRGTIRAWLALACLSLAQPCTAGIVLTITPTARVDTDTLTYITYTLSAAADSGTQGVTDYLFRLNIATLPVLPNHSGVFFSSVTKAGDGTVWGPSAAGPFTQTSVSPISNFGLRYATQLVTGAPKTIDTFGGVVGTFEMPWNRPLTGQYDAAIGASYLSGGIALGVDQVQLTTAVGAGVSTLITAIPAAVPEPGALPLLSSGCVALWWLRRRRRA